ncbi:hypothetical protein GCM10009677_61330 [Sphaerisporangium rubeum]|uniref:DNA-binding GntR family transcriptional regulator n=1 Tax=Sphaerisporangium rubeum TaxID=321317 RepID=A0A7X0M9G0_9ACTN|nr:GntR family transcriptional regulator [Sphaerisporangium rubeum]MBB6476432.1 DNA-binding GntR family transcriptional regulator [Sphaerisporangium rubeum]
MEADEKEARWRTIATALRNDIIEGRYTPGSPLPSEITLAEQFSVSRPTVRDAIKNLVLEGLVNVIRGRGTFVRPLPERQVILITNQERPDVAAPGYHPDIVRYGWDLGLRDQEPPFFSDRTQANRDLAIALGVRLGHSLIHRESLWTFENHAKVEIHSYANADMIPDWDDQKRNAQYRKRPKFLYQTLAREHGPMEWMTLVMARMPSDNERIRLNMQVGDALLIIRRHMVDRHGRRIEVTDVKAPANQFEIAYALEVADDPNALFTREEMAENGITLVI